MSESRAREGIAEVPGARLRYRLAGAVGAPLLVFENGWGASYEMWTWVERELAAHAQLLFYNRAGIGGSELLAPQTARRLSAQFAALPRTLGLQGPVIAVGQSYGGLMCSLHAAQRRDTLLAVIEIDPTPQVANAGVDAGLKKFPPVVRLVKTLLRLGLPNFLFAPLAKSLPAAEAATLLRVALSNTASLDAGLAELALLDDIRAAIAARHPTDLPRLLIGAGVLPPMAGLASRLLTSPRRAEATFAESKLQQHERAMQDANCRVVMLGYDHGALVFNPEGAHASAQAMRDFIGSGSIRAA